MEQLVATLAHLAWAMVIILIFAIIGVIATIRWIFGMLTKGEQAVVSGVERGVQSVEDLASKK